MTYVTLKHYNDFGEATSESEGLYSAQEVLKQIDDTMSWDEECVDEYTAAECIRSIAEKLDIDVDSDEYEGWEELQDAVESYIRKEEK